MPPQVICYGELGVDNLIRVPHLPEPELAAFPESESYHIGGAAANTAVWLAAWGIRVQLAGNAIGDDEYGRQLLGWLRSEPQLDLRHLVVEENVSTPFCRVLVTPDGERTFLVYWYPRTPKQSLTAEMIQGVEFLALDLYGGPEREHAVQVAREAGVTTVVGDVIWPDHAVLPLTDVATNSAAYIRHCFPGVNVREHSRALQQISGGIVVTTDGRNPVHTIIPEGVEFLVQPPEVTPVDATGAGDAFRAGLIYGMLMKWPLERCVCYGVAAGSFSVQHEGAASARMTQAEVQELADTLRADPSE